MSGMILLASWSFCLASGMDVLVVGGGAAGVQAALVLARARREVTVVDEGEPRNARAAAIHNLAGHEGIAPGEWLAKARADAERYGVRFTTGSVTTAIRDEDPPESARVGTGTGMGTGTGWRVGDLRARALVLATGVREVLPAVEGLADLWGRDVVSCPYCHGWEATDKRIAVVGDGPRAWQQLRLLRRFTADLALVTNGSADADARPHRELESAGVAVFEGRITRVVSEEGGLRGVAFADGAFLERDVLFAATSRTQASVLPAALGCTIKADAVVADGDGFTGVPGVWAAGSCAQPALTVAGAIGHATTTAIALNNTLIDLDLDLDLG